MSKHHNKIKKANKHAGHSKGYLYNLEVLEELDSLKASGSFPHNSIYKIVSISKKAPYTAIVEAYQTLKDLNGKFKQYHFYKEDVRFADKLLKDDKHFNYDLPIKVGDIVYVKLDTLKMRREVRDITGHKFMNYVDTLVNEIHAKIPMEKYATYGLKSEMFEKPAGFNAMVKEAKAAKSIKSLKEHQTSAAAGPSASNAFTFANFLEESESAAAAPAPAPKKSKSPTRKSKSPSPKAKSPTRKSKSPSPKAKTPNAKAKSPNAKGSWENFLN